MKLASLLRTAAWTLPMLGALAACSPQSEAPPVAPAAPVTAASAPAPAAPEGAITRYKANGYSPAWQVEVEGAQVHLQVPEIDGPDVQPVTLAAERSAADTGVTYTGQHDGTPFTLNLRPGPCTKATEGDAPREFHATLEYGQSHYEGCADALR